MRSRRPPEPTSPPAPPAASPGPPPRPAPPRPRGAPDPTVPSTPQGARRDRDVAAQRPAAPRATPRSPTTSASSRPRAPRRPRAQLHVDAPWDGYDEMKAGEIVARVSADDPAAKAVVRLYEQTHKKRKSILDATDNAPGRVGAPGKP